MGCIVEYDVKLMCMCVVMFPVTESEEVLTVLQTLYSLYQTGQTATIDYKPIIFCSVLYLWY